MTENEMSLSSLRRAFASGEIPKPDYIEQMHAVHARLYQYASILAETDVCKIEICDGEVTMTIRSSGIRLACDAMDQRTPTLETLNFGEYESKDSRMLFRIVRDGDRVYDIGANHGWYTIHLARRFPSSIIDAFEPIPPTFEYLQRNLVINAVNNVITHCFGLGDTPGESIFYYYPQGSVNASMANLSDRSQVQQLRCSVKRIDDEIAAGAIPPDFMKVDVEGAELFVFKGAIETLRTTQAPVFAEMLRKWAAKFNYHPNEIIALFSRLGYSCFRAEGDVLVPFRAMNDDTLETNFFFLHPERSADQISALVDARRG